MDENRQLWYPSPTVELARVVHVRPEPAFSTVRGSTLETLQFSYESWGALNERRDNAVLVIHPLALDCHATGGFDGQPEGWWEPLIGPGRPIDTERCFVVCPNLLGGCYGSTGPRFPAADGEPYLERFPLLSPLDLMRSQRQFLGALGIERVRMVIGPSMGGMIAWEWAIEGGDSVEQVVAVAAPLRTTAYQIGLNWLQRRGIELDLGGDEKAAQWGQMIARGVGMLSYRSAIGLEEKFGREWFQEPGATLGERGMFNVESWLRHHGKRNARRFDAYTYILFSRAMDLHDVGRERGGFVSALDRIRCPVLVIGISSDQLYSASDVHLGADILTHLERPVSYEEIRSPHGHDAFLLEAEQLGAILREAPLERPGTVPRISSRDVQTVRLGVLGAGKVAAVLLRLLEERRQQLRDEHDLRFQVVGVAEIDRSKQLDPIFEQVEVVYDPESLVTRGDIDAIVDLTRGTGSHPLIARALARRRPVATPNKALVRKHGPELERLALDNGVRLAYHNSIAAGWPLLYTVDRPLGRQTVTGIRALLSSACNVILEHVEQGLPFEAALARAQELGITEPDPDLDVSGWDSAQKLSILVARSQGTRFPADEVATQGIADVDPAVVRNAAGLGYRVRLTALFLSGEQSVVLGVLPVAVGLDSHLGAVRGDNSIVVLDGGESGEMVYLGKGHGDLPVASAVLVDLIGLYQLRQSWTGRYPTARRAPIPPAFTHCLAHQAGETRLTDARPPGAVPVLDSLIHSRVAPQPV